MGRGAFIDTGAGATWAEALLFPPWIADERDGTIFRNLPAIRFKQALDASERGGNCAEADCSQPAGTVCTYALCPGKRPADSSFHGHPTSQTTSEKHRGR